jgi:hypothetical protein
VAGDDCRDTEPGTEDSTISGKSLKESPAIPTPVAVVESCGGASAAVLSPSLLAVLLVGLDSYDKA